MEIKEFSKKVEAIRQYRASKDGAKKANLMSGVNAPTAVELHFGSETRVFTLSGNEMASLLSEFPDINSINDLFAN
jgi:hypothetical protein